MSRAPDVIDRPALGADLAPERASVPPIRESITPADLADLMASFEDAARALQATHESLQSEVRRLEGELRETKTQLRRAQDLAALGEMAAGIAHEIRNPLGSIRLYADMLVADLADRPSERSIAAKVARAVDSMNGVVTDVLAFSREIRLAPQPVDVRDLFTHAIDACAGIIDSTHATVRLELAGEDDVSCDPSLMHQALVNVIRNACEAGAESGDARPAIVLSSSVRTVLNDHGRRTPMRVLRVEDNGPGIPAEVQSRMFNPFFTTRHTGTGLGLAIVHRILDAHAGRVDIKNRSDDDPRVRGAIVDLLLPLQRPSPDTPHGDSP